MSKFELRDLIAVAFFAALTSVGALISFPHPLNTAVPIAFANLFAVLSGAILGKKLGPLSQSIYVLMGLIGIPVFAKFSAGPGILFGATGGYLFGYILAAFVTGLLVEHLPRMPQALRFGISMTAGFLVVYLPGVPWLAFVGHIPVSAAFVNGCLIFLPVDAIKVIVGTLLCLSLLAQIPQTLKWSARVEASQQAEAD